MAGNHPTPRRHALPHAWSFALGIATLAAAAAFATAAEVPGSPPPGPSYPADIRPLLEAKCLRCHNPTARKADLDLSTHAAILKGGESGAVVVPGKPDESPLFELVHEGKMPAGGKDRLRPDEVERIRHWIEVGAPGGGPDLSAADATATGSPPPIGWKDVAPILWRRCVVCHGRDVREAGLDLRSRVSILRGGESGPAIVPSDPKRSRLVLKIDAGAMPPRKSLIDVSIKPIEPAEAAILSRWIEQGAPEGDLTPDVAGNGPDPLVADKDRDFWSFRPPVAARVAAVRHSATLRNPIDAFVLEALEIRGLTLAPEADRAALLRRIALDLTGLLPEPDEVDAFLADTAPDAYERVVDRLLASPRYGERWGRHWLDLAGYADSEGKREQDLPRPFAWRYRDYVIRALNADKPFNRFLLEQVAGDELADYRNAPEISREIEDNLVATGFLRMAPDPTWANPTNFVEDRLDIIADEVDVLGSGVLGLTLKCARCHSHKYDPIPQRDYYRLVDLLKGAYDENDWLRSGWDPAISKGRRSDRELAFVTTAERRRWEQHNAAIAVEIEALRTTLRRDEETSLRALGRRRWGLLSATDQSALIAARSLGTAAWPSLWISAAAHAEATLPVDPASLKADDPAFRARSDQADRAIAALQARILPEPTIRALWDRGEPSPTYVYRRGDPGNPGPLVGPGVPSVLTDGTSPFPITPPWPGAPSTGRRLALGRWLTRPDHPLTGRVLVNRIWKQHFGNGLVSSLGNFGKAGVAPTHPQLLDWLAVWFVEQGWSLKALHRLMVTSATYRQSSAVTAQAEAIDPENRLHSRHPLSRMEAEVLHDAMLQVAGRLDPTPFGPPVPFEVRGDGLVTPTGTPAGWRRGVYVRQERKRVATLLEVFDLPQMNPNCLERRESNVATQALHLWNDGQVRALSEAFAGRVATVAGADPARRVEAAFRIAAGRPPTTEERLASLEALARLADDWARAHHGPAPSLQALATFCHALLNSASFLYID